MAESDGQLGDRAYPSGMRLRFALAYMALFAPFGIATPYLQVLLRGRGLSLQAVGWTHGVLDLMGVLAPPLWGYLGDRWQRPRSLMLLAVLGAIPAFAMFQLAPPTTLAMMAVAVGFGFCFRPLIPLTDGVTFRYIQTHGGDYGTVRTGGSVAFVVTSTVVGYVVMSAVGGHSLIMPAMLAMLTVQAITIGLLPGDLPWRRSRQSAEAEPEPVPITDNRRLITMAFLTFCFVAALGRMAMTSYYQFYTLFVQTEFPGAPSGLLWGLGTLCEVPVLFFSLPIMRRIGVRNLFLLGMLGVVLRLVGFSFVTASWQLYPLQLLHALTFGAYHAASVTVVSRLAPAHRQGTAQTMFVAITMGIGGIGGGALGGWTAQHYGFSTLFSLFAGIASIGLVLALFLVPRRVGEETRRSG